jgi:AraC family transcriptional regulator
MAIDAMLQTTLMTAQLVRFDLMEPVDSHFIDKRAHWLYQVLTPLPKNSRACYPDCRGRERFDPLGDVFLVPAGQTLRGRSESGSFAAFVCLFQPDPIRCWFEDDMKWTDRHLEASLNIRNANIHNLLRRLKEETCAPGFASKAMAELIIGQLAIELKRYYTSLNDDDAPAAEGLAPWRLRLIDERLMDLGATPTLTELAQLCNLSVRQLTRAFRASRGCSIGIYIAQRRVDKARQLLADGQSVKAVAYSLGFASPEAFGYAFRRATGKTPGMYRQLRNPRTCGGA